MLTIFFLSRPFPLLLSDIHLCHSSRLAEAPMTQTMSQLWLLAPTPKLAYPPAPPLRGILLTFTLPLPPPVPPCPPPPKPLFLPPRHPPAPLLAKRQRPRFKRRIESKFKHPHRNRNREQAPHGVPRPLPDGRGPPFRGPVSGPGARPRPRPLLRSPVPQHPGPVRFHGGTGFGARRDRRVHTPRLARPHTRRDGVWDRGGGRGGGGGRGDGGGNAAAGACDSQWLCFRKRQRRQHQRRRGRRRRGR